MKILFISDVYFPRINGVSTSIEIFRHELRALGHTVHMIAPDYLGFSSDESEIMRVPSRQVPFDPEDRMMKLNWVMAHIEKLGNEKYDIIHIQTPFIAHYLGIKLSRLLDIPCVETYHTFFEGLLHHYIRFLPRFMLRSAVKRLARHQGHSLDGMVVPSHSMMEILRNYGVTTHTEVIPTGLEPESFLPGDGDEFRKKYGVTQDRPMLLFVGRLSHEKNISFLLHVTARVKKDVPEILFLIAGGGPAREGLEHETNRLGLTDNVMFIGYLDRHTELNSCYHSADIFIFSSQNETQGLVLLEAMAQGVPVVSTAEMGTREILREGAGVWIAKEELDDFSGKVIKMLGDVNVRAKLGEGGREYAHGWSADKQAERMLNFYQSVIHSNMEIH